ncbi:Bifunctional protein HldE [Pseudomonas fluorescens]|nr:Bifunctional protein HldE [Pseudomonas fluorescens]
MYIATPRINNPADLDISGLAVAVQRWRRDGQHVVLCHGCFDPLHHGHLLHLTEARQHGDLLIVTVTADRFVGKGAGRPVFSAQCRAEMLAALRIVDGVAVSNSETAVYALETLMPHVYVKGIDYLRCRSPNLEIEIERARTLGIQVEFTTTRKSSATEIAQRCGWLGGD